MRAVNKYHLRYETVVENVFNPPSFSKSKLSDGNIRDSSTSTDSVSSENGRGFLCNSCHRIFARFIDFDDHLMDDECAKKIDFLEIEVKFTKLKLR